MRYYIATSTGNMASHNFIRDSLAKFGHEITYDWTKHGSVRETNEAILREIAHAEFQGILDADFVVVLLPGGKGTHAELGFSIASQKQVFICSEDSSVFEPGPKVCVFYHHADVIRLKCPSKNIADQIEKALLHKCNNADREGEVLNATL
jgi:nucleoside 2-deoxyribosyltransferase